MTTDARVVLGSTIVAVVRVILIVVVVVVAVVVVLPGMLAEQILVS